MSAPVCAAISADGRFVAFWDGSVLLVRDLRAGTAAVASRASGPEGAVDSQPGRAYGPASISADGRFVAFDSPGHLDLDDDEPLFPTPSGRL